MIHLYNVLYLTMYYAGRNGYPILAQHRSLARDAFVFWPMYWEWVVSLSLNFPVEEEICYIFEQFKETLYRISKALFVENLLGMSVWKEIKKEGKNV